MKGYEDSFLSLLKSYLNGENAAVSEPSDVKNIIVLAQMHNVLPFVYAVSDDMRLAKIAVLQAVGVQTGKNIGFSVLYDKLTENNINPIVLKGPICSALYPDPDFRISSDFDLFLSDNDKLRAEEMLLADGYEKIGENYISKTTGIYLELHTSLNETDVVNNINTDGVFRDFESTTVNYGKYKSLGYNENLFYLIYHAFKHFIGSGFGIRQIMDIALFADKFRDRIDFTKVFDMLGSVYADSFGINVLYVAEKCLGFDFSDKIEINDARVCFDDFISDILAAGVFGKSSENRMHSAQMVTDAVAGKGSKSFRNTLFPKYSVMKNRYGILKYLPFLLPLFWLFRIIGYLFKTGIRGSDVSAGKTIQIAENRIELMKKLNIIR